MNEITLSNDLDQIELEINHHKNIAGQSIWEIGRRLNHVKENDLAHGQFMEWLENIGIEHTSAKRMMKTAKEIPNSATLHHLGETALYLISTLPEEEKQKELSKAEAGEPSTVRELRELKKHLKEKEQQITEEKQRGDALAEALEKEQAKPQPKPIVQTKEVKPADYDDLKSDNQQLQEVLRNKENQYQSLRTQYQNLIDQRSEVDEKSKKYDELNDAIKRMQGQLDKGQQEIAAQKEVYDLVRKSKELIAEVAPLTYLIDAENVISNEYAKKPLIEIVNKLHDIARKIEEQIEDTNIIEGEIING
ncbi:hypothetical protein CJ191_01330 [Aerococcus viridans]|uniref:DUF3102 domain-containing protein n=1 Tax=Aerococcus viridans TaxID=1377 RepID=A0A2N6UFV7_9LACT|nr:hypothetical protein [Aerococcus viridans]PMC80478.1 hypothetical protein CJ191_01330 [Aerococcus viridans]